MKFFFLILMSVSVWAQTTTQTVYHLPLAEFLKISQSGRHKEVLGRASEVLPSERNDAWEKAVATSAKSIVGTVEEEADREWAFEVGKRLMYDNPSLAKDSELMMKLGDLAVRTYSTKGVAVPFYANGLKKNDPKCSEPSVREAVSDAFTRPGFEKEKKAAVTVITDLCASAVSEDWAKEMIGSDHALKPACPGLLKLGKLSGVKKAKCERSVKENT